MSTVWLIIVILDLLLAALAAAWLVCVGAACGARRLRSRDSARLGAG